MIDPYDKNNRLSVCIDAFYMKLLAVLKIHGGIIEMVMKRKQGRRIKKRLFITGFKK